MLGMPSRLGIDRGWFCGLSNQEAAQADGEEEAPQAAAKDARSAQKQEVAGSLAGRADSPGWLPGRVGDGVIPK
jgi:hypothetical protein